MKEEYLLTGELEPTNEPYAIAKIAGIKLCQSYNRQYKTNFISVMPTNLYGPGDNYDLDNSHVLPALIRKFHEAQAEGRTFIEIWGTGEPRREFLFVDDLADACVFLMKQYNDGEIINIGVGQDIAIKELAQMIKELSDTKANCVSIPPNPTAHRESFWMFPGLPRWDGRRKPACRKVSGKPGKRMPKGRPSISHLRQNKINARQRFFAPLLFYFVRLAITPALLLPPKP